MHAIHSMMSSDEQTQLQVTPKISYVIPFYNARRFIQQCLQSIFENEAEPFNVIIVDDGSTEEIYDIISSFGPAIHYIRQENQGAGAARNAGIQAATGAYIRFVDADDVLLSTDALRQQLSMLDQHPSVGLVYGQSVIIDDHGQPSGSRKPRFAKGDYVHDGADELERLLRSNYITTSTTVIRRSLIEQIGVFRTDLRAGQDYDFWIRIAQVSAIAYVSIPVAAYRKHATGITALKTEEQRQQKMDVIDRLFMDEDFARRYAGIRPRIESYRTWKIVSRAYRTGNISKARKGAIRGSLTSIYHRDWELLRDYSWMLMRVAIPERVRDQLRNVVRRRRSHRAAETHST